MKAGQVQTMLDFMPAPPGQRALAEEDLLLEVLDEAITITNADFGNIQLVDAQTGDLKIVAQRHFPQWWIDYWNSVSVGHGACGTALERGNRVIVDDVERSPIFAGAPGLEMQRKAGVRAVQSTPLVGRDGRVIGMFSTHYRQPFRPDAREERLLDLLARHAADAIERLRAETALRDSEERYRALVQASSDVVYRMAPDWSEMRQVVGRDFTAGTNNPSRTWLQRYVHSADQPYVMARIQEAIASKSIFELEHRVLRFDGSVGWTFSRAVPRFDDSGEIAEWVGMASDITERKRAETALQDSEERLRLALAAGGMAIWEWEIDTGKARWNDEHYMFLGYAPGSITPSYEAWRSRVVPEDLPRIEAAIQNALRTGEGYTSVYRVLGKNDVIRWVEEQGRVRTEAERKPRRLYGVVSDITDRITREQDLRQRLDEIEALYDNAPIGLTLLDRNLRYLRVNSTLAMINGAPASAHQNRSVPDVLPTLSSYVERKVKEVLSSGQIVKGESSADLGGDGRQRTFREIFYPLRDGVGSVSKVGIIVEDITERKRAEEQTELLLKEVNHRAKNLLAVIQSIAQLTADHEPPESFYLNFSERLRGLAASHDLLVEANWQSVSLATLIKSQLPHFAGLIGDRILIKGPGFELGPSAAQAIGMALHELGTNAAKYGALSTVAGRVKIGWTVSTGAGDGEPRFVMTWEEEGGPTVAEPQRLGFGHAVTVNMPEHLLEADVSLSFMPSGAVWTLSAPLAHVGDLSGSEGDECAS